MLLILSEPFTSGKSKQEASSCRQSIVHSNVPFVAYICGSCIYTVVVAGCSYFLDEEVAIWNDCKGS